MTSNILKTIQLSKKYKHDYAVRDVNITIKKGDIYGLIGRNGAGKSTILRLITGLAFPSSRKIALFGDANPGLNEAQKRMGAMIEGPAYFPNMTAAENLEVHRLQKGIPGKDCIGKTLELVGLRNTGEKKVKHFSLGMKQRL